MRAASAISPSTAISTPASPSARRCIKDGKAYVQAGGGWVNDSTPEGEFQETVNKSMAMRKAVAMAEGFAQPVENAK